jgi:hypothetical protein
MGERGLKESKLIKVLLDTNRNLLLGFVAGVFAITADARVGSRIASGVVCGLMLGVFPYLAFVHAYMVRRYSRINRIGYRWWYTVPVALVLVSWASLMTYLSLLYSQ